MPNWTYGTPEDRMPNWTYGTPEDHRQTRDISYRPQPTASRRRLVQDQHCFDRKGRKSLKPWIRRKLDELNRIFSNLEDVNVKLMC